jgi:hypothetical protein
MITLQLKDTDGNIKEEKQIEIHEGDTLIMRYDESVTLESVHKAYNILLNGLERGLKIIGVPQGVTFEVLKVSKI